MKTFIFFLILLISFANAKSIKGNVEYKNFDKAKEGSPQLKFIIESTKIGIFSSDVDGYVKKFSYRADLDQKNMILRNMKVTFDTKMIDTDSDGRNEKLHNLCMEYKKYPQVEILIPGPLFLKGRRAQTYSGTVSIRGKKKPFKTMLNSSLEESSFTVNGESSWSFKEMEIPDPSIAVAKVSDEIRISFKIKETLSKE